MHFCIVFYGVFGVWGVPDCAETICFSTLFARCHFRSFRSISPVSRKNEFCIVFYTSNCARETAFSSSCAFRLIFYTLLLTLFSAKVSLNNNNFRARTLVEADTRDPTSHSPAEMQKAIPCWIASCFAYASKRSLVFSQYIVR